MTQVKDWLALFLVVAVGIGLSSGFLQRGAFLAFPLRDIGLYGDATKANPQLTMQELADLEAKKNAEA